MDKKKETPKLGAMRDDGVPVVGMKFEDSRKKLLKFKSTRENPQTKESLINQVKLHEGEAAADDLRTEINFKYDEERRFKPKVDFIHNPNGKLHAQGIDFGKPRVFAWCNDCGQRAYVYTVVKDDFGNSINRCGRCGTNCEDLTKEELDGKS